MLSKFANITLVGVKEIDQVLIALPSELSHKVFSQANALAARPLVEKEKLLAPEGPKGNLVDSIGAQKINFKRADELGRVDVGPRRGRYKGYAAHLEEFGTKDRKILGKGKYKTGDRGRMPKRPFARPAFELTKDIIQKSIANSISIVLLRTMRKYIKKYNTPT